MSLTEWNTDAIRKLLTAAFDDDQLQELCFDYFRPVYEKCSGVRKDQKIQRLLEHCVRHDQVEKLLGLVKERNPEQYARFDQILRRVGTPSPFCSSAWWATRASFQAASSSLRCSRMWRRSSRRCASSCRRARWAALHDACSV